MIIIKKLSGKEVYPECWKPNTRILTDAGVLYLYLFCHSDLFARGHSHTSSMLQLICIDHIESCS